MDQTPRLRSAYPRTPPSSNRVQRQNRSPPTNGDSPRLPDIKSLNPSKTKANGPLVSFESIDAPTQRLYAAAVYVALFVWRLADFFKLQQDQEESLWLFLKWIVVDGSFLFGLPSFRIPWLEWSSTTMTVLFMLHAIFDAILMFRIPVSVPNIQQLLFSLIQGQGSINFGAGGAYKSHVGPRNGYFRTPGEARFLIAGPLAYTRKI